ncbi:MAG: hypothetical protein N2594_01335 [Clostridiales bacterium]|nr:hypothetical protein [Clostridiales bacterium]
MRSLAKVQELNLKEKLANLLQDRKNLMYYDGIKDGLDENIAFKYFYSSPKNPLEFIIIDIFNQPQDKIYGNISIIVDYQEGYSDMQSEYGNVVVEKTVVRDINKLHIKLELNEIGIKNIEEAVEFFEGFILNRTLI